jgi:hypothetical protein
MVGIRSAVAAAAAIVIAILVSSVKEIHASPYLVVGAVCATCLIAAIVMWRLFSSLRQYALEAIRSTPCSPWFVHFLERLGSI